MKCPKCNRELRESKKTPGYYLCDTCKKKFSQETLERFAHAKGFAQEETTPEETPQAAEIEKPISPMPQEQEEMAPASSEEPELEKAIDTEEPTAESISESPVYSNIPPEHVRTKREKEMRQNYEALLNIKEEKQNAENEKEDGVSYDGFDHLLEEEPSCRGIRLLLGILSLVGAAYLGYLAFSSGNITTFIHTRDLTGTASMLLVICLFFGGIITLCMQNRNSVPAFLIPAILYIGGSVGGAFLPGSVLIVKILICITAVFGAFMLFFLCCAKKIHIALRILVLIIALAACGGGIYAAQKFVVKETFGSKDTLRLSTDNFTAIYEKTDVSQDYEGVDSLLVYYTITNKGDEPIVPSVAVTFKAIQNNTTLESTIVPDETLTENESKEIKKGDSVRVCTSFRLIDKSDITLQVYESYASDGKRAETTISL